MKSFRAAAFFYFIFLLCVVPCVSAQGRISEIDKQKLAELSKGSQWRALLHYHSKTISSAKSTIDSPDFFLAPNGHIDPEGELKVTLAKLLDPSPQGHALRCKFAARYRFLTEALPDIKFPARKGCQTYVEWYEALDVESVSFVFIDSFLNNPASLFGHNLLRLNSRKESELLSYAVQYSATVNPADPGVWYAIKGMFGGYKGFYSVAPYYASVSKYSESELRDIWEYPLKLRSAEVDMLLRHLWELQETAIDYFYFDDNCSALLAELLEAAAPRFRGLRGNVPWKVPIDLLQKLSGEQEALDSPTYRPSRAKKVAKRYSTMLPHERKLAQQIASAEVEPKNILQQDLSSTSKKNILELAHDLILLEGKDTSKVNFSILQALSSLPPGESSSSLGKKPISPEKAHPSRRFTQVVGNDSRRGVFYEFGFRPAYHSLTDPTEGLGDGAQIEILPVSVRYLAEQEELRLARLDLLDVLSLTPSIAGRGKISWGLNLSRQQQSLGRGSRGAVGRFDLLLGKTWRTRPQNLYYLLGGARTEADVKTGVDLFAAPLVRPGVVARLPFGTKLIVSTNLLYDQDLIVEPTAALARSLSPQWNTRLSYSREKPYGQRASVISLAFDYYF